MNKEPVLQGETLNLFNMREMTGGDSAVEKELFEAFLEDASRCLGGLEASTEDLDRDEWRRNAHSFKGISRNLGAGALADLCFHAQEIFESAKAEKTQILNAIRAEFSKVKALLQPFL